MVERSVMPGAYVYVCTRLQLRKARLFTPAYYERLLQMSLPEMVRAIGDDERFRQEIYDRYRTPSDLIRVEYALTANLAREYRTVLRMTPGTLHLLTSHYLHRWDIVNVMAILRGKRHGLNREKIAETLIPAGEIDRTWLNRLVAADDLDQVVEGLHGWSLYPQVRTCTCQEMPRGEFARVEDRLYHQYYRDLLAIASRGVPGGSVLIRYLRFEIDILNMRNLFRLRAGSPDPDIRSAMVQGGTISIDEFVRIASIEDQETFINEFSQTDLLPLATRAMQKLRRDPGIGFEQVGEMLWSRWEERRTTVHVVEVAVTELRLEEMDRLAARHRFSVLPVLSYLERKRVEIGNLRACVRGRQFGIPNERIARYLVV